MHTWVKLGFVILFYFSATMIWAQPSCPLLLAKNAERLILEGEVAHGAHDMVLLLPECKDTSIILEYANDPTLKKDKTFKKLQKLFNEEKKTQSGVWCFDCFKYRISAIMDGRLDIADSDNTSFGHPTPFTRYRYTVSTVLKVKILGKL